MTTYCMYVLLCECVLTLAGQWGKPFILANTKSPGLKLSPFFPGILPLQSSVTERTVWEGTEMLPVEPVNITDWMIYGLGFSRSSCIIDWTDGLLRFKAALNAISHLFLYHQIKYLSVLLKSVQWNSLQTWHFTGQALPPASHACYCRLITCNFRHTIHFSVIVTVCAVSTFT